jgi:hypothetical protein
MALRICILTWCFKEDPIKISPLGFKHCLPKMKWSKSRRLLLTNSTKMSSKGSSRSSKLIMTAFLSLVTTNRVDSELSKESTMTHIKHRYWREMKAHSTRLSGLCSNCGKRISKIGANLRERRQGWIKICSKLAGKIIKIYIKTSTKGRMIPIPMDNIHLSRTWSQVSLFICHKCNLDQEVIKIGQIRFMEINLMASLLDKELQIKCTTCHRVDHQGLHHTEHLQEAYHLQFHRLLCRWMVSQTQQKQKNRL